MAHVEQHRFMAPNVHEIAPGSAEERDMLMRKRAEKAHMNGLIHQETIANLGSVASEAGVVRPENSREAHHLAIKHVTGEHKIPVVHD